MPTRNERRDERNQLVEQMRDLQKRAEKENRELSADEQEQFDRLYDKQAEIAQGLRNEDTLADLEKQLREPAGEQVRVDAKIVETATADAERPLASKRYAQAFESFLRHGIADMPEAERRDLKVATAGEGGNLVVSEQFLQRFLEALSDITHVRKYATTYRVEKATSLGVPTLATDFVNPSWTTEVADVESLEDTTAAFGKRTLTPNPLRKMLKVSEKLIRASVMPVEGIVSSGFARRFGYAEESAYMTGDGSSKPLGLFTADASGISTGRDVDAANAASIVMDDLLNVKYSVKLQYRGPSCRWVLNRAVVKAVSKLKDGDSTYIWQPADRPGGPDTLLQFPVLESEYAPGTITTGLYTALFGDLSQYWIVDALDMRVQRLVEKYANTGHVGFIATKECDGAPVDENAFARLKQA